MIENINGLKCDSCGRTDRKIKKRYKGLKYCVNCYARLFKNINCFQCGLPSRLPKFETNAICVNCLKSKPCIRCGLEIKNLGKITAYGAVCNSCSIYYREYKRCEKCRKISQKLTSISRFKDGLQVCPQCATRDYETCSSCHKYRLLEIDSSGRKICQKCLSDAPKNCINCSKMISPGCGRYCDECMWNNNFLKRIELNRMLFENQYLREEFSKYAYWLKEKIGPHKAALVINKHSVFFYKTQNLWIDTIPAYIDLLTLLRAHGLRKYQLVIEWLINIYGMQIDTKAKEQCSEIDQIENLIKKLSGKFFIQTIVLNYKSELLNKFQLKNINFRSIRLAIKPAVELMLLTESLEEKIPHIEIVKKYLTLHLGQAAALTGFINFLNNNYNAQINYQKFLKSDQFKRLKKAKIETEIMELLLRDSFDLLKWVKLGLMYFHNVSRKVAMHTTLDMVSTAEDGFSIQHGNQIYWLPSKIKISR